jgi:hypothetical protein
MRRNAGAVVPKPTAAIQPYLDDLRATLVRGARARQLLEADVERVVVLPAVASETAKPFARAEVITTGKGSSTV